MQSLKNTKHSSLKAKKKAVSHDLKTLYSKKSRRKDSRNPLYHSNHCKNYLIP